MLNVVSVGAEVVGSKIGDVQYAKETPRLLVPLGLKYRKLLAPARRADPDKPP